MNSKMFVYAMLLSFSVVIIMGCVDQSGSHQSLEHKNICDSEQLQKLLDDGVNVDTYYRGGTMLHSVASSGCYDSAWMLLENNADVNAKNSEGKTPLHASTTWGEKDTALLLLKNGANVSSVDNSGKTSLHLVAARDHIEFAELLMDYDADINAVDDQGATPLHYSSHLGNLEITRLFINSGANIHASGEVGTPLLVAASSLHDLGYTSNWDEIESEKVKIIKLLIENGADVNVINSEGETPLHLAAGSGSLKIVKLLIENGGDVNALDNKMNTPLHFVVEYGEYRDEEVVKLLLGNGADPSIENMDGITPRYLAVSNGLSTISEPLTKYEDMGETYSDYSINFVPTNEDSNDGTKSNPYENITLENAIIYNYENEEWGSYKAVIIDGKKYLVAYTKNSEFLIGSPALISYDITSEIIIDSDETIALFPGLSVKLEDDYSLYIADIIDDVVCFRLKKGDREVDDGIVATQDIDYKYESRLGTNFDFPIIVIDFSSTEDEELYISGIFQISEDYINIKSTNFLL
ncbi:ankyrin repeat domain-containing protein [Methanolobus sp. ZRKC2]|uniref:ankyrin repeat domain-containing protein n=1 Tax=Methanolobus sp. ZRKC2 TaxID=3125783 RepID=UPI0032569775